MDGSVGEPFLNLGMMIVCFHSDGIERRSISDLKKVDSGKDGISSVVEENGWEAIWAGCGICFKFL